MKYSSNAWSLQSCSLLKTQQWTSVTLTSITGCIASLRLWSWPTLLVKSVQSQSSSGVLTPPLPPSPVARQSRGWPGPRTYLCPPFHHACCPNPPPLPEQSLPVSTCFAPIAHISRFFMVLAPICAIIGFFVPAFHGCYKRIILA